MFNLQNVRLGEPLLFFRLPLVRIMHQPLSSAFVTIT